MLYYAKPQPNLLGGVTNVAYYLTRALAKYVDVTCFPRFVPEKAYLADLLGVYRRYLANNFDIIHFNVVPRWVNGARMLLKLKSLRDIPTVLNLHGILSIERKFERKTRRSILQTDLLRILDSCKDADRLVVNSEYMRTNAMRWYGIDDDKIVVIPNGVDLDRFNKCDSRLLLDGNPVVLYLGQLWSIKGIATLIQAIAKLRSELPDLKLHVVGHSDVEDLQDLQNLVEKKGLHRHVVFHGEARGSMVPRYYKSADMFVLPSRHEGFGITALEAMASGTPIIASDIKSLKEIISDGRNGLLFKSGDADALARAILTLHEDTCLRKKLSQAALETARKYSWDAIAAQYVSLYRSLNE